MLCYGCLNPRDVLPANALICSADCEKVKALTGETLEKTAQNVAVFVGDAKLITHLFVDQKDIPQSITTQSKASICGLPAKVFPELKEQIKLLSEGQRLVVVHKDHKVTYLKV